MKYHQAKIIAETILGKCAPACKTGFPDGGEPVGGMDQPIAAAVDLKPYCMIGGGIRRGKADCHDIEVVGGEDWREGDIPMPTEEDFFQFCGLDWIEPSRREPRWGAFNGVTVGEK